MHAAVALGGIFGWAADQVSYAAGTISNPLVDAAREALAESRPNRRGVEPLDAHLLVARDDSCDGEEEIIPVASAALRADLANLAGIARFLGLLPAGVAGAAAQRLVAVAADVSLMEADIEAELAGMRWASQTQHVSGPRITRREGERVWRSRVASRNSDERPGAGSIDLYEASVDAWTKTLFVDGVLQVGLRRGTAEMVNGRVWSRRWAGTGPASHLVTACASAVILAAFGDDAVRALAYETLSRRLAQVWGASDPLNGLAAVAVGLLPTYPMPGGTRLVRELAEAIDLAPSKHEKDVLLLLRQLAWLRGLAPGGDYDASLPWRAVAARLELL